MCKFIKNWINKHILKTPSTQLILSIGGKYFLLYILDKYINKTRPNDYIEKYEGFIDKQVVNLKDKNFYIGLKQIINFEQNLSEKDERDFAVLYIFILFINYMSEEQKDFYLNYITDLDYKNFIEGYLSFLAGGGIANAIQQNADMPIGK